MQVDARFVLMLTFQLVLVHTYVACLLWILPMYIDLPKAVRYCHFAANSLQLHVDDKTTAARMYSVEHVRSS